MHFGLAFRYRGLTFTKSQMGRHLFWTRILRAPPEREHGAEQYPIFFFFNFLCVICGVVVLIESSRTWIHNLDSRALSTRSSVPKACRIILKRNCGALRASNTMQKATKNPTLDMPWP